MSNFLAVATVTEMLRTRLETVLDREVSGAQVLAARPGELGPDPTAMVNLFLFQVAPNSAWANADLPTRSSNGQVVRRPQLALDLHYLLSFSGNEINLEPQRLLGSVVRTLHERPLLTRDAIAEFVGSLDPDDVLKSSDLANQVESIKFSPFAISLEELSKIWSVFFQAPYLLSVAYQASVVLITSVETARRALPVREAMLHVRPFHQPVIDEIRSRASADDPILPNQPILTGHDLVIVGRRLRGESTKVRLGGELVTPDSANIRADQIIVTIPSTVPAGVQGIQVIHEILLGIPPTSHPGVGFESNVAAVVLRPTIMATAFVPASSPPEDDGAVSVQVVPDIGPEQRVVLLLTELVAETSPPETPAAYTFVAKRRENSSDTIEISIPGAKEGTYLVRIQIDGAESVLEVGSPPDEKYVGPTVEISAP